MILLFILRFVGFMMVSITFRRIVHKGLIEGQVIECVWTLVPGVILIKIALPSLSLLYLIEESPRPDLTVKAIGHQWF
jgi:cytochrome c oxidase subunit 2